MAVAEHESSVPVEYDGILLASYGGPEGQDEVIPFLRNVTRGRGIPDERLEEVAVHYRHFGGTSPINEQNRQLQERLQAELRRRGIELPVYWGNRFWQPYLTDVLQQAHAAGARRLLAVITSAYSSYSGTRRYVESFQEALDETGLGETLQIDRVREYFDHPGFVRPFVSGVRDDLLALLQADHDLDLANEVEVLFSTHSIPTAEAEHSAPREAGLGAGGAYVAQHLAVAEVIARQALAALAESEQLAGRLLPASLNWQLVYQSRSGPPSQPWLEPDVNEVIQQLPALGRRAIVVVPIGFVSDHMEVKWDLDEEAQQTALDAGLAFRRTPTPGIHPEFVAGLADLVQERRDGIPASARPALTALGPWPDELRPGYSESGRHAVAR